MLTDYLKKLVSSEITRSDDVTFFRIGRMRTETKILQKDTRKQKELAIKWQMKCSVDL